MSNANSNSICKYIPTVIVAASSLTSNSKILMMYLYDYIINNSFCSFSNKKLSEINNIPMAIKAKCLANLEQFEAIVTQSTYPNRKLLLGALFKEYTP